MKLLDELLGREELHRGRALELLGEIPDLGRAGELLDELVLGDWRTVETLDELLYGGGRRGRVVSGRVASDEGSGFGLSKLFWVPYSRRVSTHFQVKRIRL